MLIQELLMFVENYLTKEMYENLIKKYSNASFDGISFQFYSNVKNEYNIIRQGVGIRLIAKPVILHLAGNDVLDFLHRISTNYIKDLKPLNKRNTLFLNEKGRFIDRSILFHFENYYLLKGSRDKDNLLLNWINKFIITEDIHLQDASDQYAILEFWGHQNESFLTLIFGDELNNLSDENIFQTSFNGFDLTVFFQKENNGLPCYRILISKERSSNFISYIFENKSVFDLDLVGEEAYNIFRIESGIPIFPNEINDKTNPYEVSLLDEVNFKKGCYIGQEVIARLETYDKVQRKLIGVVSSKPFGLDNPLLIYDENGTEQGEITSLATSNNVNKYIGLALVRRKALEENKLLLINNKTTPISVSELPIIK